MIDCQAVDKLLIRGGTTLEGRVSIGGSKNAALPEMVASLLTAQPVRLENLPLLRDVRTTEKLLGELGVDVNLSADHTGCFSAANINSWEAPYELVKTMRASVLVLGPLLARTGRARVSLPGGCAIGTRPINLHISGLQKLGAEVHTTHGYVEARADRLLGADVVFDTITVTGTENLMMAAVLAQGQTTLRNAACEPSVVDLAALLTKMGARIEGAGTPTIEIDGVRELGGATHRVIPDRIETGTFLVAAAITEGKLELVDADVGLSTTVIGKLREAGVEIEVEPGCIRVHGNGKPQPVDVTTEEYPGFATDMQAQYMTLMTQARGTSVITENIFENRFMHASELNRMGARIKIEGRRAIVEGPTPLGGANVLASDLRASASLVLAGLIAEGDTVVDRVYHLDRGYERIEEKLNAVGASIERIR